MANIQHDIDEAKAKGILNVYVAHVTENLYQQMLDEIKPKLRLAAKAAVEEMKPSIQAYLDHRYNDMHVQIAVKGLEGDSR